MMISKKRIGVGLLSLKRYAFIDSLRGFAVIGVVLVHVGQRVPNLPDWFRNITDQGARGVQLFFILSALTLFLSMEKRKDANLSNFFIRRFFRIAPLFYLGLLFYPIFDYVFAKVQGDAVDPVSIGNVLGTLTFVGNLFSPYWLNKLVPGGWSVSVEMAFYLFVPLLFIKISSLKKALIYAASTSIIGASTTYLLSQYKLIGDASLLRDYLFYWFPNQVGVFLLGVVLHFLLKTDFKLEKRTAAILLAIDGLVMLLLSQVKGIYLEIHLLYGLLFVALCFILAKHQFSILVNKFTVLIGKISFSIYLTHFIILRMFSFGLDRLSLNGWAIEFVALFIVTFAFSILASMLTYNFIEKKGTDIANYIIKNKQSKIAETI